MKCNKEGWSAMPEDSDIRFDGEEIEVIGKRTRFKHRGETKLDLHPEGGNATFGGNGAEGDLILRDGESNTRIHVDASSGSPVGGERLRMYFDGRNAKATLGGDSRGGQVVLRDEKGRDTVRLDGERSDVVVDGRALLETIDALEARIEELETQLQVQ